MIAATPKWLKMGPVNTSCGRNINQSFYLPDYIVEGCPLGCTYSLESTTSGIDVSITGGDTVTINYASDTEFGDDGRKEYLMISAENTEGDPKNYTNITIQGLTCDEFDANKTFEDWNAYVASSTEVDYTFYFNYSRPTSAYIIKNATFNFKHYLFGSERTENVSVSSDCLDENTTQIKFQLPRYTGSLATTQVWCMDTDTTSWNSIYLEESVYRNRLYGTSLSYGTTNITESRTKEFTPFQINSLGSYAANLKCYDTSSPDLITWSNSSVTIFSNSSTYNTFNITERTTYWPPQYWTNKSFKLNISTDDKNISMVRMETYYPSGAINVSYGKWRNDLNGTPNEFIYYFNKTTFNQNGTYQINYSWTTLGGNVTNKSISFDVQNTLSYLPSSYSLATKSSTAVESTVQLWTNTNASFNYNISLDIENSSWFVLNVSGHHNSYNDTNISARLNSSIAKSIPFKIKATNTSVPNGTYSFNLTINRTMDNIQYTIPGVLSIDTGIGNISIWDSSMSSYCTNSKSNACYYSDTRDQYSGQPTFTWQINNTGEYPLSNCIPSLSDSFTDYTFYDRSMNKITEFGIGVDNSYELNMRSSTNSPGTWNDNFLQLECIGTPSGYSVAAHPGNVPVIDLTVNPAISEIGTGGAGGSSRSYAPPEKKTSTEGPAQIWGDGVCDEGESPDSPDCKVIFNFDSAVTCLWDPEISCIYGESWFIQILIYFLVGVGLYSIRGTPPKKRSFGSFSGGLR